MRSTRDVSKNQEKAIVKAIGGKRTPNSGATSFVKRRHRDWEPMVNRS